MLSPDEVFSRLKRDRKNSDLWSMLYNLVEPRLRAFSYRLIKEYGGNPEEADDIVHEVLMRLLKDFSRIVAGISTFQHLQNYLYKACRNEVRSLYRRSEVRASAHEVIALRFEDVVSTSFAEELQKAENREILSKLLSRLNASCQQLVRSYLLSEQSLADYAREHGIKLGTIYTQWQRCIEQMRALAADPL
jgi:RNA polymerase sigma factor (sigma-70 family)